LFHSVVCSESQGISLDDQQNWNMYISSPLATLKLYDKSINGLKQCHHYNTPEVSSLSSVLKPTVPHRALEAPSYLDATTLDHNVAFHRCTLDLSEQHVGAQYRVGQAPLGGRVDLVLQEAEIVGR
jgi:hypothetical protein